MKVGKLQEFSDPVSSQVSKLVSKVETISNSMLTKTSTSQEAFSLQVTKNPSSSNDVVRYQDIAYQRIVNHTNSLQPSGPGEGVIPRVNSTTLNHFIIKLATSNKDYLFDGAAGIENKNYRNIGPLYQFCSDDNTLDPDVKVRVGIDGNKIKIRSSMAVTSVQVYHRTLRV